jgi:hypothetical protein
MPRRPLVFMVALGGLIGLLLGLLVAFAVFLFQPPPITTGVVREDRVFGPGNRPYRRQVRVECGQSTITTSVTFTQIASGGVGRATFIQPDLPPIPRCQRLVHWVRVLYGLPVFNMETPQMIIPYPMKPGEKWIVRFRFTKKASWIEGHGKAPQGAIVTTPTPKGAGFLGHPWGNPLD